MINKYARLLSKWVETPKRKSMYSSIVNNFENLKGIQIPERLGNICAKQYSLSDNANLELYLAISNAAGAGWFGILARTITTGIPVVGFVLQIFNSYSKSYNTISWEYEKSVAARVMSEKRGFVRRMCTSAGFARRLRQLCECAPFLQSS